MGRGRPKKTTEMSSLAERLVLEKEISTKKKVTFSGTIDPDLKDEFDLLALEYTGGNRSLLLEQVLKAFITDINKVRNTKKNTEKSSISEKNQ